MRKLSLIKLNEHTEKAWLPALIYAIIVFVFSSMAFELFSNVIGSIITFFIMWLFFKLLQRTTGSLLWWLITISYFAFHILLWIMPLIDKA